MVDFPRIKPRAGQWYYCAKCSCGDLIPLVDDPDDGKGPFALSGLGQFQVACSKGHLGIYSVGEIQRLCYQRS